MSWEPVTDVDSIRGGEPLRVLGQEGWEGRRRDGIGPWLRSSGSMITSKWMIDALVERGQVERRAEPDPHPDDVEAVADAADHMQINLTNAEATVIIRALDQQRRARGES